MSTAPGPSAPSAPMHTLAAGLTPSQRYGSLGGFTGKMIAPPWSIRGFVVGYPKSRKSAFFQSCPHAFILNADKSSTTTNEPKAVVSPGLDSEGRALGDDGKPMILTWDFFHQKKLKLLELAQQNKPRPKMVVFDSLGAGIQSLFQWIPLNAVTLGIRSREQGNASHWRELHGPAAYDVLYTILVDLMVDLHNAGYGFWYVGHINDEKVPLGEDRIVYKPELTITSNFYKRLYPAFDMIAAIHLRDSTKTVEREVITTVRGVEKKDVRRETVPIKQAQFCVDDLTMARVLGDRVKLPGVIDLPETGGWQVFEDAYLKAASA